MEEIQLRTAPADFRFPTTNQTRHCFTRYIEFHRCIAAKGEESAECENFARYYRSLCPGEWISPLLIIDFLDCLAFPCFSIIYITTLYFIDQTIQSYMVEKWNEQRDNGTFPGPL